MKTLQSKYTVSGGKTNFIARIFALSCLTLILFAVSLAQAAPATMVSGTIEDGLDPMAYQQNYSALFPQQEQTANLNMCSGINTPPAMWTAMYPQPKRINMNCRIHWAQVGGLIPVGTLWHCIPDSWCGCFWLTADKVVYNFAVGTVSSSARPGNDKLLTKQEVVEGYKANDQWSKSQLPQLLVNHLSLITNLAGQNASKFGVEIKPAEQADVGVIRETVNDVLSISPNLRYNDPSTISAWPREKSNYLNVGMVNSTFLAPCHAPLEENFTSDLGKPFPYFQTRYLGLVNDLSALKPLAERRKAFLNDAFVCNRNNKASGRKYRDLLTYNNSRLGTNVNDNIDPLVLLETAQVDSNCLKFVGNIAPVTAFSGMLLPSDRHLSALALGQEFYHYLQINGDLKAGHGRSTLVKQFDSALYSGMEGNVASETYSKRGCVSKTASALPVQQYTMANLLDDKTRAEREYNRWTRYEPMACGNIPWYRGRPLGWRGAGTMANNLCNKEIKMLRFWDFETKRGASNTNIILFGELKLC